MHGVVNGIRGLASVLFGLSFAALGTFFLLKDGQQMRRWVDRHVGLPEPTARMITGSVITSLRGYFRGVTIVAAFNGVVVGLAALLLDVPLAGTIAVVSFVTAYVPYIGAFVAGTFAVLIALGAQGTGTAVAMLVVVLLANGLLQNLVQPFAMGSALHLNPLVVLVVTIGAGCLFGMLGLVLAAPLVSAAVKVAAAAGPATRSTRRARTGAARNARRRHAHPNGVMSPATAVAIVGGFDVSRPAIRVVLPNRRLGTARSPATSTAPSRR